MDKLMYPRVNTLEVHKKTLDKNYNRKNALERAERFKDIRRQTRHGVLLKRRNIDEKSESPFVTPETNKPKPNTTRNQSSQKKTASSVVDSKIERLKKWKAEKERRKLEEKKNAKPLFKICKVPVELGLPKLDNVNREIKGKPIKPIYKSIFAPKNHIFQAPKNVKSVNLRTVTPSNKENLSSIGKKSRITIKSTTSDKKVIKQQIKPQLKQIITPKEPTIHKNVWKLKSVKPAKNKSIDENVGSVKSANLNETSKRLIRSSKQKKVHIEEEPILIEDSIVEINGNELDHSKSPTTDRETIYSDDEISIRTPSRKSITIRKSKGSTPYSKMLELSPDSENEDSNPIMERKSLRVSLKSCRFSKRTSDSGDVTLEKCVLTKDSVHNRSLSGKSVNFMCEPTEGTSPENNMSKDDVVDVSVPKNNRKSHSVRFSTGASNRFSLSTCNSTEAAAYFTRILDNEIERIEGICDKWNNYKTENDLTEDVENMINAAIGLSKLLIAKKFPQFRELIEECHSSIYMEKPIMSQDLQGYWDTAYLQVEDLDKKFAHLEKLKRNHWQEVLSERKKVSKKPKSKPKKKIVASKLKDMIKTARNKKKEEGGLDGSLIRLGTAVSTPSRLSKSAKKQRLSGMNTSTRKSTSRRSLKRKSQLMV